MATARTLHVMTLGTQQSKTMTTLAQPNPNCVIVKSQHSLNQHPQKTVLINLKRPIAPTDSRSSVLINNMSTSTSVSAAASAAAAAAADMLRCKRRINFTHHHNNNNNNSNNNNNNNSNTHLTYAGLPGHQPASVARRNARERNRVKQVNNGFATLRSHIPLSVAAALASPTPPPPPPTSSSSSSRSSSASKKLSKVDTLRMAVEYIRSLKQLLDEHDNNDNASTTSAAESSAHNDYYSSSPEGCSSSMNMLTGGVANSQYSHHIVQQSANPLASLSPPCSEASSSPTPSYASEGSGSAVSSYATTNVYQQENYENYEPMSPEDEELLDVISWWQQSQ